MAKLIQIPDELYTALCDLEAFVRDCCMTASISTDNPIAPMSKTDNRTVAEVLDEIDALRGGVGQAMVDVIENATVIGADDERTFVCSVCGKQGKGDDWYDGWSSNGEANCCPSCD